MPETLNQLYRPIQSQLKATESLFIKELVSANGLMGEMTRYVTQMSGKMIRPVLALLAANLVRSNKTNGARANGVDKAICLAASVEMIHTATLLHDDVIDGATLRRGILTLHAKWGDTLSVLSGDYLYSKAFCLLSSLDNPRVLRLMSDTARTVCEGEVAQIQHRFDLKLTRAKYLKIIEWKTASLMGTAAECGALLAGATQQQAKRLGQFGLNFGLAFQILDDTQDLVGDEESQGKSLGTDLGLGHLTLPLIYLKETADAKTKRTLAHCFNGNGTTSRMTPEARLRFLKEQALRYKVPVYCRRSAQRHLNKAKAALEGFPASEHKASLQGLAEYLIR